jgi:spectrin alpha
VHQKAVLLEQTHAFVSFKREANELLAWINDKTKVAGVEDIGSELESCEALQKKFEDFNSDIAANEPRLDILVAKSLQLISEGHPSAEAIHEQQEIVNTAWSTLRQLGINRAQALADAHEVHTFTREVDETKSRIQEKAALLSSSDEKPHGLLAVEIHRRKHEGFERDLAALEESVISLNDEAKRLARLYVEPFLDIRAIFYLLYFFKQITGFRLRLSKSILQLGRCKA